MVGAGVFSSPPRMRTDDPFVVISSSPELPSFADFIPRPQKRAPLRSGSRAAPVPEDAVAGFTSAARVWRTQPTEEEKSGSAQRLPAPKSPRKKTSSAPYGKVNRDARGGEEVTARDDRGDGHARQARNREQDEQSSRETSSPDKPWRKFKSPGSIDDGQRKIPRGRITKAATGLVAPGPRKTTDTVSKHFPPGEGPAQSAVEPQRADALVDLEPALARRMDWTPPHDTRPIIIDSDSSALRELTSPTTAPDLGTRQARRDIFKTLRDDYGHTHNNVSDQAPRVADGVLEILGKRKLVDMVDTTGDKTPKISPTKSKAPKKKPRTITELATAAYQAQTELEAPGIGIDASARPPRKCLGSGEAEHSKVTATHAQGMNKRAPRKKKNAEPPKQPLLSPTSAMRQVSGQDFVFGTSSQLVREDSPNFLRDLHAAMKASNKSLENKSLVPEILSVGPTRPRSRSLWAAGARDDGGELLDIEVIDLVGSPIDTAGRTFTENTHLPPPLLNPATDLALLQASAVVSTNMDSCGAVLEFKSRPGLSETPRSDDTLRGGSVEIDEQRIRDDPFSDDMPPPSNQEHSRQLEEAVQTRNDVPPPKYELFTDAQLAREVARYGFKAIKKRTAMIALLDQCWASSKKGVPATGRAALSTVSAQTDHSPATSQPSPKRPRGRPRKDTASETAAAVTEKRPRARARKESNGSAKSSSSRAKAAPSSMPARATPLASTPKKRKTVATQPVIEIADSDLDDDGEELPLSPSPFSSPSIDHVFSSPPAVDLSMSDEADISLAAGPTDQQSALFGYIGQAVTTAPRSKDPLNPSWHEKMLMYDPVVLEDFTAWLNEGQLDRVGYDEEVSPGDVKRWCESKSICCLWRVNLHGKERKRF